MENQEFVKLDNGVQIPLLGLGTSHNGGYSHSAVVYALKECGYRLIDTAKRYGCEEFLGQAIKDSNIPREEIFLSTKLWPTGYGYRSTIETCRGSMKRLDVDYLDMYLLHWPLCRSDVPSAKQVLEETWRALEKLYDDEVVRAIGVSNYDIDDLEDMFETCSVKPHVNQVEFHPYQNPLELREFCNNHRIQIEGYCPLAKGKILSEKPVMEIASEYHKTPAQVLIKWSIQNGIVTIPKSIRSERVLENSKVFDFMLAPSSLSTLNSLPRSCKTVDVQRIAKNLTQQVFN